MLTIRKVSSKIGSKLNKMEKRDVRSHRFIFWDRPSFRDMSSHDFRRYIEELRQKGRRDELARIVRRFVQWGSATEGVTLFRAEEIKEALEQIRRSSCSLQFCDPVRLRAWEKAAEYAERFHRR